MGDGPEEPLDDPLPGLRAELDQAAMMIPEIARIARGFYGAFVAEGFSNRQALYMTVCQLLGDPGSPPADG